MKAENTLQYMADFYSDIFPTRKHALNFLFCVVGNGYEWENGELVDKDDTYIKRYSLEKDIEKAEFIHEDYWNLQHDSWMRLRKAYQENGEGVNVPLKYQFEWAPIDNRYVYLTNYPEDIKEDWLDLINECKEMLKEVGIKV